MTHTDAAATRDKERTRQAILDAAQQIIAERGANVSIADIAEAAGVTKGGLMHHFPSRDALLRNVLEHCMDRMWDEVHAHIDLSENRPGKFARGFVRALTGDSEYLVRSLDPTALIVALGQAPGLEDLYRWDADRWRAAFAADGLPPGRVLSLRFAAEGLAMAVATPYLTDEEVALVRAELLALAEDPAARVEDPTAGP